MHIPDGYLSPSTCALAYAAAVPCWAAASRRAKTVVRTQSVPMLAVFSALSFLVMMFNVPIPDGTTAHAVGAVIIAIALGPWAAVIAVSVALLFQALLFGDGGVLAYGVNAVNMAVLMPFAGYGVYRLVAGRAPLTGRRRVVAAAAGGYVGINVAALATAVEFGVQPELFTTSSGTPLYSPYHLSQTLPAMLIPHLTVAGFVEGALTAGVLVYLQRADVALLERSHSGIHGSEAAPRPTRVTPVRVAVAALAAMAALTPLGLLAPGGAFGEDAPGDLDLRSMGLAAVPSGLDSYNGFWRHTVLGGYGFAGGDHAMLAYALSALLGILAVGGTVYLGAWLIRRVLERRPSGRASSVSAAPGATSKEPLAAGRAQIPRWLLTANAGMCSCGPSGLRTRASFVERTLTAGSAVLRQAMFGDDIARERGLLQRIDARVKLIALIVLLVSSALLHNVAALAAMYAASLGLAAASRVPIAFFVKRVWLFIPIFTLIVVAPATLSVVTDGDLLLQLWTWNGTPEGVTAQGLQTAGLMVARVAVSISLVLLLTLTTEWSELLSALRSVGVPRIFILVIGMAHRYVYLLLDSVAEMYQSRKARTIGAARHDGEARRFVASTAGALFAKATHLSEEVHHAMVSRGYRGDAKTLQATPLRAADGVFLLAATAVSVVVLTGDRILGR